MGEGLVSLPFASGLSTSIDVTHGRTGLSGPLSGARHIAEVQFHSFRRHAPPPTLLYPPEQRHARCAHDTKNDAFSSAGNF